MAGRLEGKKALITAAAQGIGRASAEAFVREGAEVIATDINMDALGALKDQPGVTLRKLDVLDGDAVKEAAGQIGAVDALFNCAGFVHHGTLLDTTDEDWDFSFNLNVKAMFRMCRAFLPAMLENGGGSIINMSSVSSSLKGIPTRCVYGASKAAVLGLTKSISADYLKQGIRCNAVCPGTVQSPSLDGRINAFDDPVQARKDFIARQPLGRLGTAEEIAAMVLYLASDESAYTTGQFFVVDGGILN
ncbi:SDR family oxidoreductase [Nisaea acidiphila]|uniref:SDR family oxidoreductase n=1 Tax=Nisaea acidiphila TaxID=1862145 RepID=A0A9J7AV72_9PROT|nr:SDR family oxidoreductase [Nisaea acidiphila]UUX51231.1 SDR family oxidoreductase [Nisaea acidiphila]